VDVNRTALSLCASDITDTADVGYAFEAAFSRAFKREMGVRPAGWRQNLTTAGEKPLTVDAAASSRRVE
jgi:AraC-like DNA-binding protein